MSERTSGAVSQRCRATRRARVGATAVAAVALLAAGCGGSGTIGENQGDQAAAPENKNLVLLPGVKAEPFYISMQCGAEEEAAELGYTLDTQAPDQFEAALQHRTEALTEIGERIIAVTSILEQRRKERQQLVASVLPQGTPLSMAAVADRLQGASRAAFESCWKALESAIRECKILNMRNCRLLMDQYEIMQRVLNVQSDTYAPA